MCNHSMYVKWVATLHHIFDFSGDSIIVAAELHTLYRPVTQQRKDFFDKLPEFSARGKKFVKHATRWNRKNGNFRKMRPGRKQFENDVFKMDQVEDEEVPEIYMSHMQN